MTHEANTIHQRHMKQSQQIHFLRYDERQLLSTQSIYACSLFKPHQANILDLLNPDSGVHPTNQRPDEQNFRTHTLNQEEKKQI